MTGILMIERGKCFVPLKPPMWELGIKPCTRALVVVKALLFDLWCRIKSNDGRIEWGKS